MTTFSEANSRDMRTQDGFTLERLILIATLTFITLLYTMAIMIVNVALPDIRGALSATQDQVAWVVTANIMASAVATPLAGWVAGRFGTRQVMLTAAVIFTIASVLCGTAESLEALVMYRILQGFVGPPYYPCPRPYSWPVFLKTCTMQDSLYGAWVPYSGQSLLLLSAGI